MTTPLSHSRKPGIALFAHGSRDPLWRAPMEAVRQRITASGNDIRLEVDGGIKVDNIRRVADAGADTFVAGSAIFGKPDYKTVVDAMRAELAAR